MRHVVRVGWASALLEVVFARKLNAVDPVKRIFWNCHFWRENAAHHKPRRGHDPAMV
ncbi:hypothetical protein GDO78_015078 [Eleutherodactylus coqui]|uniref:Uncharacterized protein n=1 Tax=Eleutherodactylus coqui TaxID=57060 RepID=A0A8J6BKU1_ELECQ|nr:hypothetical protein GDO78_015078 [Eleutherodactylus coqui]